MNRGLLALALLLAFSTCFAEFRLQNVDVSAKLDETGAAVVQERIDLIIISPYSMQLYESGFNKNTLSAWQEITGLDDIKLHVSSSTVENKNLIIRPQPLTKSGSGLDVWYAQIILDYEAHPYYDVDGNILNGTGMVTMDQYKPRTVRYTLNPNAFNLPRTDTGSIKVAPEFTLNIIPPSSAVIKRLNPIPTDIADAQLPIQSRKLSWSGLTLVQFTLEYDIEQSLDHEVLEFFTSLQDQIGTRMRSAEGIAAIFIIVVLVGSYLYLNMSKR
jgi:hypothetical protein